MNGFINILKPVGATASDMVVCIKHILHEKKIGHLGTLDPGASGVLPVALGLGTKLFDFLTDKTKKYRAFFTFGKTTDTLDSYGNIAFDKGSIPSANQLQAVLNGFKGEFDQVPPIYSAKSVGGVRAYKLARDGIQVKLKPRKINIYDINLIAQKTDDTFVLDITCGGGTYIRSIVRDIADNLNTVGYMSGLIRLQSGCFDIEQAYTIDEIRTLKEQCITDIMYPLSDVEEYCFDEKFYEDLDCGRKIKCPFKNGFRKIYCRDTFFGLGQNVNGLLKISYYLKNAF